MDLWLQGSHTLTTWRLSTMNKKLSDLILSTQSNLVINSELAVRIGLNEAVVLRQIYY